MSLHLANGCMAAGDSGYVLRGELPLSHVQRRTEDLVTINIIVRF